MSKRTIRKKQSGLSLSAFYTGIIGFILILSYNYMVLLTSNFLEGKFGASTASYIILSIIAAISGLSIAAVVCGSIDLNRIKKGLSLKKGRLFDIVAITLGIVAFLSSATLVILRVIYLL